MSDETKTYDLDGDEMVKESPDGLGGISDTTEDEAGPVAADRRGAFKQTILWEDGGYLYVTSAEAARDMTGPWPVLDARQGKEIRRRGGEPKNDPVIAVIFGFSTDNGHHSAKLAAADRVFLRLDDGPWFQSAHDELILTMAGVVLSHGFPTFRDPLMIRVGPSVDGGPVVASIPLHGPAA